MERRLRDGESIKRFEMKKVNVLISTYNGEKYIREQLNSIKRQTYKNIDIYVRDDGSSDGTINILREYEKAGDIRFIEGTNKGFGGSFMELLKEADSGDYWSFCDQDDVWGKHKIQWAVEWLDNQKVDMPLMFHSAYYLTDEKLNVEGVVKPPLKEPSFCKSITEVTHMGFSSVINKELREEMLKANPDVLASHDHLAELIVMKFGDVYFDERPTSLHRRLTYSVSGSSMRARIKWLMNSLKGDTELTSVCKEFYRIYSDLKNDSDYKVVSWFVYDRYSFIKAIKKAFYPHRWRSMLSSELIYRGLMLMGRI